MPPFGVYLLGLWVFDDHNLSEIALVGQRAPEEGDKSMHGRQRFDKWTFATLMECENGILIIRIDRLRFKGLIFNHKSTETARRSGVGRGFVLLC